MCLALVTMFADQAGQVQIGGSQGDADFFAGLAAGAGVGRFAEVRLELTAARTPKAAIGFLGAFEQQDFVLLIEAIQQRGDLEIVTNLWIHSKININREDVSV